MRKRRLSDTSFRCKNLDGEFTFIRPYWRVIKGSGHRRISFRNRSVDDLKSVRCPVKWWCKRLNRFIEVSEDAVYNVDYGFLCDCSTNVVCNHCGSSDYSGYGIHLVCNNCNSGKIGSRNDFSGNCVWVKGVDSFHSKVFFGRRLGYFPKLDDSSVVDIIGHEDKLVSPLVGDYYAVESVNPNVKVINCNICHNSYSVKDIHSILGQNVCVSCYPSGVDYDDSLY